MGETQARNFSAADSFDMLRQQQTSAEAQTRATFPDASHRGEVDGPGVHEREKSRGLFSLGLAPADTRLPPAVGSRRVPPRTLCAGCRHVGEPVPVVFTRRAATTGEDRRSASRTAFGVAAFAGET